MSAGLSRREQQILSEIAVELGRDRRLSRCLGTGRAGVFRRAGGNVWWIAVVTLVLMAATLAALVVAVSARLSAAVLPAVVTGTMCALTAGRWHRLHRSARPH